MTNTTLTLTEREMQVLASALDSYKRELYREAVAEMEAQPGTVTPAALDMQEVIDLRSKVRSA